MSRKRFTNYRLLLCTMLLASLPVLASAQSRDGDLTAQARAAVSLGANLHEILPIDGRVLTEGQDFEHLSADFGGSMKVRPQAVVSPKSLADLVTIVKWAYQNNIPLTPRGTAHTVSGQTLADTGVIIKTELLTHVSTNADGNIVAQPGARVISVVNEANASGNYLPALPAFMAQTVGGILSVGGVGPGAHTDGLTIDNILELSVVTGTGEVVVCSPSEHTELFDAVLGGLGQFGIIASATFAVKPAQAFVHTVTAAYPDVASVIQEMLDSAENTTLYAIDGYAWSEGVAGYVIEKAVWSDSPEPPEPGVVFPQRNNVITASISIGESSSYLDYAMKWNFLHGWWGQGAFPWADFFVPKARSVEFFEKSVRLMQANQALFSGGTDFLGITVVRKQKAHLHSIQQLPETDADGLYFVPQFTPNFKTPEEARKILALNRDLLDMTMSLAGKTYVIDELPDKQNQWYEHFGDNWPRVQEIKKRYDPRAIMGKPLPGLNWE